MDSLASQTTSIKQKASQSEETFERAILAMNEIKEYSNGIFKDRWDYHFDFGKNEFVIIERIHRIRKSG